MPSLARAPQRNGVRDGVFKTGHWMPFGTRISVSLPESHTKLNPIRALRGVPLQSWVALLSPGPQNVTFFETESLWV